MNTDLPRSPQDDGLPSQRIALSPSGISPWSHEVELHNGRLSLYWQENGVEKLRTFTAEETAILTGILYDRRREIFFPPEPTP